MSTNQPITTGATPTVSQGISGVRIRSPLGLLAAIAFLLALPIAYGCQVLLGSGAGIAIHLALGAGSVLLAFAVFDFQLPRWMNWIGCAAALALGTIFFCKPWPYWYRWSRSITSPMGCWGNGRKDGCPMCLSFG